MTAERTQHSVGSLIFGAEPAAGRIEDSLRDSPSLRGILGAAGAAGSEALGESAAMLDRMLEVDLVDIVLAGWRAHQELVAAAVRTSEKPGLEEVVVLAAHTISASWAPSVELLLDGVALGRVDAGVEISAEVQMVSAVVREGVLTTLRCGRVTTHAALTVVGAVVASRSDQVELGAALTLRRGIDLLPVGSAHHRDGLPARSAYAPTGSLSA